MCNLTTYHRKGDVVSPISSELRRCSRSPPDDGAADSCSGSFVRIPALPPSRSSLTSVSRAARRPSGWIVSEMEYRLIRPGRVWPRVDIICQVGSGHKGRNDSCEADGRDDMVGKID